MAKIKIDYENNAEQWWDGAQAAMAKSPNSTFGRVMDLLETEDDVEVDAETARIFRSFAREIPGWNGGPPHAPNPVIVTIED